MGDKRKRIMLDECGFFSLGSILFVSLHPGILQF